MKSSRSSTWKFARIRYNSPLEKSLRRPTYVPDLKKQYDVKKILKKYLGNIEFPKKVEVIQESQLGILQSFPVKNKEDFIKDTKLSERKFKYMRIRSQSKTPSLNCRKNRQFVNTEKKNSAPVVKKAQLGRCSPSGCKEMRFRSENRFTNSNYSSYADIYNCLVEQIPLQIIN